MVSFPETIVLSLPADELRREHIHRHFEEIGLTNYRFEEGISADSPLVASWYATGRVKNYPPCFRCGKSNCGCANNILIPAQVANCLSFARIWAGLPKDPARIFLICEDDVLFFPGAIDCLKTFLDKFVPTGKPLLIRLSESGLPTEQTVGLDLEITDEKIMSNPAYIINGAMADLLTRRFNQVETTSDIWLHARIASEPEVESLSLKPRLATELSFNVAHARFKSHIHPKGIDEADRQRQAKHVKRVDTPSQYARLRRQWEGKSGLRQWNYLASPPFQMRYMLATGLLRKFDNILEIGAYKTPYFKFLEDEGKVVRCVDPLVVPVQHAASQRSEALDYRSLELEPFDGQPFALVIMGMDLPITYKLKHYLERAEVAIIEFPEDAVWKRSREAFDQLVHETNLHTLSQVRMDFDGNDFSQFGGPSEWPPRVSRYVYMVSRKYQSIEAMDSLSPFAVPSPVIDTSGSRLINTEYARDNILKDAAFEFSHGGACTAYYLGGGLLYYTLPYMLKSRVCVCLGSGGAFVPRLMRQAQRDIGLGEDGKTILIDGDRGSYGRPNWMADDSAFRLAYPDIEIRIADTVAEAAVLASDGVLIDYLHIDADHSHEGSLRDFDAYLPLMRKDALITFHDTRPNAHANTTCWRTIDVIKSRGFEVINMPFLASGVAVIRV